MTHYIERKAHLLKEMHVVFYFYKHLGENCRPKTPTPPIPEGEAPVVL